MMGGKDHTTHHLVYKGLNDFQVWLRFLVISIFSFLISILLEYFIDIGYYFLTLIGILYFLIVFVLLYRNTIKFKPPN
jgi:UDP-GlcNAc:undecaprenyl-phosphate GlcNAc-1-phosphate transferase